MNLVYTLLTYLLPPVEDGDYGFIEVMLVESRLQNPSGDSLSKFKEVNLGAHYYSCLRLEVASDDCWLPASL